jgi:hypothetical protein
MTFAGISALVAGIATIVGGIVYFFKVGIWLGKPTPDQTDAQITTTEEENEQKAEETGRPQ